MNVAAILKVKSRNVVTTTADKSLLDVAKLIDRHDIGCIVIEGDDGQIAGVVSERDLVCAIGIAALSVSLLLAIAVPALASPQGNYEQCLRDGLSHEACWDKQTWPNRVRVASA